MSKRTGRKQPLLALVVVAVMALAACRGTPAPEQETPRERLRVAFNTWIGYSSFYIAEEQGIFSRLGIEVETQVIDALAEKNAALLRGDLDAIGGTIDSTIVSAASGVAGKVVFMFDRSNGTDGILVAEGVENAEDLTEIQVAVEEGFVGHFFLLYYLNQHGIAPSQVSIVPMTTDAAGAAFAAGQVDAAVTWEPYLSEARSREGSRVLVSSADLEPILADTLFVPDRVLDERRADIELLVKALQEGNDFWIANPEEANRIVSARWQMPIEEVVAIMATDELYSVDDQRAHFGSNDADGHLFGYLSKAATLWLEAGVVDTQVAVAGLIDGFAVRSLPGY